MKWHADDERVRQVGIAAGILLGVACGVLLLWQGWLRVPGPIGEFLGMIVGIMSSPFFLEGSFLVLGVLILMVINAVARHRDGEDFVTKEQLDAREAEKAAAPPSAPHSGGPATPLKHP